MEEEESWCSHLKGYAWAHVANARRVANDFVGADEAFAQAWGLWRAGAASNPDLLPEWRMLDLEASLRREQHRFLEDLALLDLAASVAGGEPASLGQIFLKKVHIFEEMGDIPAALAAREKATPFVEASGDSRLLLILRFGTANHLCHTKRYAEAEDLLVQIRELALQQGNELDLIRVAWLAARVALGQGRREEAVAGLEQVCQEFTSRQLPYDAARVYLELAALWLADGRTAEVQELAVAMVWIFKAQGISREALAALSTFCEAAQRKAVTMELILYVLGLL